MPSPKPAPALIKPPAEDPRHDRESAAEFLGLTHQTLACMAVRGDGPFFLKLGARCIYLESDLIRWMIDRRVSSTGEEGFAGDAPEPHMRR